MTLSRSPAALRDAFYALCLAQDVPDAELLEKFVLEYPEYADDLVDFAIELALDALPGAAGFDEAKETLNVTVPTAEVMRAMSRFQNQLYAVRNNEIECSASPFPDPAAVTDPFVMLDRQSYRALAQALHANTVFVSKLRDRLIDPKTITEGFHRRLADGLSVSSAVVVSYLAQQPTARTSSQFYRADRKPEVPHQQSFEEAVRTAALNEDQQRYLLSL